LLILGDFGLDRMGDPVYDVLRQSGLTVPLDLNRFPRTLFSSPKKQHYVDHIAWMVDKSGRPLISLHYTGSAGIFDFTGTAYNSRTILSSHISDH
jgi:hypothetical protein